MPSAHQLNVSLTAGLDEFVRTRAESGMYATSSEVVREGLRLLQHREREAEESLDVIRKKT
jgi:antitoxin ParD1/3/4